MNSISSFPQNTTTMILEQSMGFAGINNVAQCTSKQVSRPPAFLSLSMYPLICSSLFTNLLVHHILIIPTPGTNTLTTVNPVATTPPHNTEKKIVRSCIALSVGFCTGVVWSRILDHTLRLLYK